MKYLLDTNIIIEHLRGKRIIPFKVVKNGAGISIITLGELLYGAYKSKNPQKSLKIVKQILDEISIEIENLSEKIVDEFAKIKVDLERRGERIEDFDLLIAATAKVYSLVGL